MVEPQIVDLVVEGSSPFIHPCESQNQSALVAQLDRVLDFESIGCRFEPCRAREFSMNGPLAQLVEQQTLNLWVKGSIPLRLKR